jgi:hypothetical protein
MADIDIVQPVEGAARVTFDYTAAGDALDALSAMGRKLSEQGEGRLAPKDEVIVGWLGHHRDEFDRAWNLLDLRFQAGAEGSSYEAIWDANAEQTRLNNAALHPPASPGTDRPRRGGPI